MTTTTVDIDSSAESRLERAWQRSAGVMGWLSQVNHRALGMRFIVTALVFFLIAGVNALLIRLQLARPLNDLFSPETYNQMFTMHGTTMMFLFGIPIVEGVGMYLVPMMIGARDMAFPRLNAFGYWVYLLAGVALYTGFAMGKAPDGGWFNYVPLTTKEYSPGLGIDFYTTAITFLEVAALVASIELIVTILKMRAPGMTLSRMPLFVWAMLVTAFMILLAMPAVMLATVMLSADRFIDTNFFNLALGGDPLLWQHLFWIFGHPEVYILLVPGLGIISTIVSTFSRRPNVAYSLMVVSLVAIGFISFGLWVHHMFTTGLPQLGLSFFAAASMLVAIPSGILVFSWIATLWGSKPALQTPMLFILGFLFIFILGGITGVMVGSVPFDDQVHDTYFVVAHFHYVIIGGMLFPLFAGIAYWLPKVSGRMYDETLGKISFWLMLIFFNVTFFPMHLTGFWGMPRRYYTYQPGLGLSSVNLISTIGAFGFAAGVLLFLATMAHGGSRGQRAGENPWGAGTLEWAIPSPPPPYAFSAIPTVTSRYPLWGTGQHGPAGAGAGRDLLRSGVTLGVDRRETMGSEIVDADPDSVVVVAGPSIWPLFTALSVGVIFLGSMVSLWLIPVGCVLVYVTSIGWLWPRKEEWSS